MNPATGDFDESIPLSSVPVLGTNLGMTMTYSSNLASAEIANASTSAWGTGWASSLFPSLSWDGNSADPVTVDEANGTEITFTPATGSTCPYGDYSNPDKYTGPASSQSYCAPYRVDGQLSSSSTGWVFLGGGEKLQLDYDIDGTVTNVTDTASTTGLFGPSVVSYNYKGTHSQYAECPSGLTCYIIQGPNGYSTLYYNSSGVLTFVDPDGRTFTWTMGTTYYGATGYSVATAIANPDGTWHFSYAGSVTPVTVQDTAAEMTTVTDPDNNSKQVSYTTLSTGSGSNPFFAPVTSTTDYTGQYTTTYSYGSSTCGQCLQSGQTQTTTVGYPKSYGSCTPSTFTNCREVDTDTYSQGVLSDALYGNPNSTNYNEQVQFTYTYPADTPSTQDGSISEEISHIPSTVAINAGVSPETAYVTTDAVGNILTVQDNAGNTTTNFYDDYPNGSGSTQDPGNNLDELCWSANASVTIPASPACKSPPTGSTSYTYDSWGNVISATDPTGDLTTFGYYEGGEYPQLCWVAPPSVQPTTSATDCNYGGPADHDSQYAEVIPIGSTAYQYNGNGQVVYTYSAVGESDQTIQAATYNPDGQVLTSFPPDACPQGMSSQYAQTGNDCAPTSSYETSYFYDPDGLISYEDAPDPSNGTTDQSVMYEYDAAGNEIYEKDQTGETANVYDADNRVCWSGRAGNAFTNATCSTGQGIDYGAVTKPTYLADTNAEMQTADPDGNTTTMAYNDPAYPASPTEVEDPMSISIIYNTYDDFGNLCVTGPEGAATCTTAESGDSYDTYNSLNERISNTDPLGNTINYAYGAQNGTNPYPDLASSITQPGENPTKYSYDADGRQTAMENPEDQYTSTGYNSDGQVCWQASGTPSATCANPPTGLGATTFAYDYQGDQVQMVDNNSSSEQATSTYTYDADGNILSTTNDNNSTVTYSYLPGDHVACIGYPVGSKEDCTKAGSNTNTVVRYSYADDKGDISSISPWTGGNINYGYSGDGLNDVTKITYAPSGLDEAANYEYDLNQNLESASYTGPIDKNDYTAWGYNDDELVDSSSSTVPGVPSSPTVGYDNVHNWIASNTNPGASGPDAYTYNANGELATDTPFDESSIANTYNADDELTSSINQTTNTPSTYSYTAAGQRCWSIASSVNSPSCSSPPSPATSYGWNSFGQLCWTGQTTTTPSCSSSGGTTYMYDGHGERMTETTGSATTDFTWNAGSASSVPLLLDDGTNAYIYGPLLFGGTAPVAAISSSGAEEFLASTPSGVQLTFNASKQVTTSTYSTYGATTRNNSTLVTPFGFQGGYTDPSGLIFLDHRYYDPSTGQFLSVDPALRATGQPYEYAGDDPLDASDPSGQLFVGDGGQTAGAAPGGGYGFNSENSTIQANADLNNTVAAEYLQAMNNAAADWLIAYHAALEAEWMTALEIHEKAVSLPPVGGISISVSSSLTITGSDRNPVVTIGSDGSVAVGGSTGVDFNSDGAIDGVSEDLGSGQEFGVDPSGLSYTTTSRDVTVGPDQVNVSITATIEIRGSGVDGDGTTGADAGAAAGGGAIAGVLWWVLKPVGLACPPPFEVPCILTF